MTIFETNETRQLLVDSLKHKTVTIKFTKVNGEFREMDCTLMENIIPSTTIPHKTRKSSPNVLSVWDTNKNDWRSIRWENILEVTEHN